jgi:hypothetical protein
MAMTLVSTVTVGSGGAASIEFTGIAGTGKDLLCLISARTGAASVNGYTEWQVNSDTGNNYVTLVLVGNGATASSSSSGSYSAGQINTTGNNATASTFGNGSLLISNYTSSTAKSISIDQVGENNATTAFQEIRAANYSGTSAITSLKLNAIGGNFLQHSTASLYIVS